jgi:hypothetical protein
MPSFAATFTTTSAVVVVAVGPLIRMAVQQVQEVVFQSRKLVPTHRATAVGVSKLLPRRNVAIAHSKI